jgi:hypothetical protein
VENENPLKGGYHSLVGKFFNARKAMIFGNQNNNAMCECGNHRFNNLLHILNNCAYNMKWMTERHNAVQLRVTEAIMKYRRLIREEINENKTIMMMEDWFELNDISMDEYDRMRSDVSYLIQEEEERKRKLIIVE